MSEQAGQEGWWNPRPLSTRSKFHYVSKEGRTLCKRWLYILGDIEPGRDDHSNNCKKCMELKKDLDSPIVRLIHYWTGFGVLCMTQDGRRANAQTSAKIADVTCEKCKQLNHFVTSQKNSNEPAKAPLSLEP